MNTCRTVLLAALAGAADLAAAQAPAPAEPFRMTFTSNLFTEVSLSDARAAMKVWMETVAKDRDIAIDSNPNICATIDEAIQLGRERRIDGYGLTTDEYATLARTVHCNEFALSITGGRDKEIYVVLVRADAPAASLDDLAGRTLNLLVMPRMSLALIWLDLELMKRGRKPSGQFFGAIARSNKATQTVLPLYFGKTDAALVTQSGFNTLVELNPDLGRRLRVLATSPAIIPSGFAFRADRNPIDRGKLIDALEHMGDTPAGRQILTLTKSDRIVLRPISCLDETLALLAEYAEQQAKAAGGNP